MEIIYQIAISEIAEQDIQYWKKSGQKIIQKKISNLISDIQQHPYSGIGKPEALKFDLSGKWSRRIDQEHRIIYEIDNNTNIITIHSLRGHY